MEMHLKLQWDTTTYLPEWIKLSLIVSNIWKDVEQWDQAYTPGSKVVYCLVKLKKHITRDSDMYSEVYTLEIGMYVYISRHE